MGSDELDSLRAALLFPVLLPVFYRNKKNSLLLRTEAAKALNSLLTFFIIFIPSLGLSTGVAILFDDAGSSFLLFVNSMLLIYWIITVASIRINSRRLKMNQPTSYLPSIAICKAKP